MFVISTIPQLEEALRSSAREVMVVGESVPKLHGMMEDSASIIGRDFSKDRSFLNLLENFSTLAVYDNSQNVIAIVLQQSNDCRQQRRDIFHLRRVERREAL